MQQLQQHWRVMEVGDERSKGSVLQNWFPRRKGVGGIDQMTTPLLALYNIFVDRRRRHLQIDSDVIPLHWIGFKWSFQTKHAN